MNILKNLIGL